MTVGNGEVVALTNYPGQILDCEGGDCPAIYLRDQKTAWVQGPVLDPLPENVTPGEGELVVEIPLELIEKAAARLNDVSSNAERFELFLAGKPLPSDSPHREAWVEKIKQAILRGASFSRVQIIPTKLTPYLRYEIEWGYFYNVEAGDEIYLLEHDNPSILFPNWALHDFWLFDDSVAARMNYDQSGKVLEPELITDSKTVAQYCQVRDTTIKLSTKLQDYLVKQRNQ